MPEKPGTQNTAACENQVKQQELSDHWKLIKMYFLKKNDKNDATKTKRLTEIQVLTKEFTNYKVRCKSLRKRKWCSYLNKWTIERSAGIQSWINLIKSVESNNIDNVYW